MSQAETISTDIKQTFKDTTQDLGILDLIKSISSKATKRPASEVGCPELHHAGLEVTSNLRELVQNIKRKRLDTGATDRKGLIDPDVMSAFSLFNRLKLINRRIQHQNIVKREEVKKNKDKVNARYLILKAREAELQFLKDQIFTLKKQSELVEDISILPEEEFDLQATEPYIGSSNKHEKMLNRLKFELHQRKKLQEQLQEVGKNKSKINLHCSNFKKDIAKIRAQAISLTNHITPLGYAVNKLKSSK